MNDPGDSLDAGGGVHGQYGGAMATIHRSKGEHAPGVGSLQGLAYNGPGRGMDPYQ
jgi:hypothetical protein